MTTQPSDAAWKMLERIRNDSSWRTNDNALWNDLCQLLRARELDAQQPTQPGDAVEQRVTDAIIELGLHDCSTTDVRRMARAAIAAMPASGEGVGRRALLWLAGGDSGLSSKAIAHHMLGMKSDGNTPWDPADLGRCLRMLELFPEWKPRIGEMARYGKAWAGIAAKWDELAALMQSEVGIDWSKGKRAPLTYAAIDAARGEGKK